MSAGRGSCGTRCGDQGGPFQGARGWGGDSHGDPPPHHALLFPRCPGRAQATALSPSQTPIQLPFPCAQVQGLRAGAGGLRRCDADTPRMFDVIATWARSPARACLPLTARLFPPHARAARGVVHWASVDRQALSPPRHPVPSHSTSVQPLTCPPLSLHVALAPAVRLPSLANNGPMSPALVPLPCAVPT